MMNVVFGSASVSLALPTIVGPAVAVVVLVASCDLIRNWRTLLVHLTPLPYLLLATYFCLFRSVLTRDLGNPLLKSDPLLTHLFFDNWKTDLHLFLKPFFPKKVTANFLASRTESFVKVFTGYLWHGCFSYCRYRDTFYLKLRFRDQPSTEN